MQSDAKIYPSNRSQRIPFIWSLVGFCLLWFRIALGQESSGDATAMHSGSDAKLTSCASCVQLRVSVSDFIPIAGSDYFVDGYGVVYSHTILTVLEPADFAGRKLTIEHVAVPDDGSIWRSVGDEAFIELSPVGLESTTVIIPASQVTIKKHDGQEPPLRRPCQQ